MTYGHYMKPSPVEQAAFPELFVMFIRIGSEFRLRSTAPNSRTRPFSKKFSKLQKAMPFKI